MHELIELLRGRGTSSGLTESSLEQLLLLAEEEHVLPAAIQGLLHQLELSPPHRSRLKALQREAAITAFYLSSELATVLKAFAVSQVMSIPLKGPFLAERLYGDAARRVSHDLDILVPVPQLPLAEKALASLGYRPGTPDDYHRQWYRGPTTVELHNDLANPLDFNVNISAVLARATASQFHGQPCWQLAPQDELLFLCLHGVRHRFERLSLVLDLASAFKILRPPTFHTELPRPHESGSLLTLGLAMARHFNPQLDATVTFHATPAQQRHLQGIADRLWNTLLTVSSEPLDWRELHAFYLEMELPKHRLPRRIRHARILLDRVIEQDYEFAARFGCHRTWQVRLLRPLRIMADLFHRKSPSA
jgi:hypothetical protein